MSYAWIQFSKILAEILFVAGYRTIIQHQNTQLVHQGYSRGQFPLKTKSIQWLITRAELRRLERKLYLFNTNEYHQKKNWIQSIKSSIKADFLILMRPYKPQNTRQIYRSYSNIRGKKGLRFLYWNETEGGADFRKTLKFANA